MVQVRSPSEMPARRDPSVLARAAGPADLGDLRQLHGVAELPGFPPVSSVYAAHARACQGRWAFGTVAGV